ncbi:MAG: hypothetical protein KatS3mg082_0979 [Nitrospiraceae bacterium]|nr:MAG: hypothetical protein KatS3mg082_0979 [Nitrospiraceae bacterium]
MTRPVVVGCLLGECPKIRLVTSAGARVGDAVLLTKGIPIEAVSILARERHAELRRRYPARFVERCRRYFRNPGISVVRDAQLALAAGGVHAMHDPTEGGLSAALYELAEAAHVGLRIEEQAIPILPEGRRLCEDFGLHPLGAIASGALLICAEPICAPVIVRRLARGGILAARIGTVVPRAGRGPHGDPRRADLPGPSLCGGRNRPPGCRVTRLDHRRPSPCLSPTRKALPISSARERILIGRRARRRNRRA